jgi:hypothetical protein
MRSTRKTSSDSVCCRVWGRDGQGAGDGAGRGERSRTRTAESAAIRVEANRDDAERLALLLPGEDISLVPTHWSFGQLASLIGAPASYLR